MCLEIGNIVLLFSPISRHCLSYLLLLGNLVWSEQDITWNWHPPQNNHPNHHHQSHRHHHENRDQHELNILLILMVMMTLVSVWSKSLIFTRGTRSAPVPVSTLQLLFPYHHHHLHRHQRHHHFVNWKTGAGGAGVLLHNWTNLSLVHPPTNHQLDWHIFSKVIIIRMTEARTLCF